MIGSFRDARPEDSVASPPYPAGFPTLRLLGFVGVAWIVLNQFRDHLGLHVGDRSGLVFKGYLGAALYFITTGFLVAHRYARESRQGGFRYRAFLWSRLSRSYPLHLATIVFLLVLLALALRFGIKVQHGIYVLRDLPANLLLVQAWGAVPVVSWNFPSWLISAECLGFLLFPPIAAMTLERSTPVWLALLGSLLLFGALYIVADSQGVLFTDMTAQIGALHAIPAFLFGASLYRLGQLWTLPRGAAILLAAAAVVWIAFLSLARASDLYIWPAFGALVFGLAEASRGRDLPADGDAFLGLSTLSYVLLLVYLPADILYFHAVQRLVGEPHGALAWAVWAGVFPFILLCAVLAYVGLAAPARRWLERRNPFAPGAGEGVPLTRAAIGRSDQPRLSETGS